MTNTNASGFFKCIDNFWYHNKWKTMIIAFFVIVIAVCLVQCMSRENPDQYIFMYLNRNVSTNQSAALDNALTPYFNDYNGNGRVDVLIDNVSYNPSTAGTDTGLATSAKVLGEIGTCQSVIYLVDETEYNYFMQDNLRLFEDLGLPDMDGHAWNWKGSELQKSLSDAGLPEDMYFCIRRVGGTTSDSDEKKELCENALEALRRIIAQTPL